MLKGLLNWKMMLKGWWRKDSIKYFKWLYTTMDTGDIDKIRKKLKKDFDDMLDVDEDSDIPISERKVKDKKIREIY